MCTLHNVNDKNRNFFHRPFEWKIKIDCYLIYLLRQQKGDERERERKKKTKFYFEIYLPDKGKQISNVFFFRSVNSFRATCDMIHFYDYVLLSMQVENFEIKVYYLYFC